MSLELCILASGSTGNASVLRTPAGVMLIDAGIGPRTTAQRLEGTGVGIDDLRSICLTHLDHDHFNASWVRTIVERQIQVFCDHRRIPELLEHLARRQIDPERVGRFEALISPFTSQPFYPLRDVRAEAIFLQHDSTGSHGFVMDCQGVRLGYATDLGRVPKRLIDGFCDLDLLALESNYDPDMQEKSPRPWVLKQRITGGAGHLSNAQALAAIQTILDRCESRGSRLPAHIVLLHRSAECNCPNLLRMMFCEDPRIARRLTLSEPHARTEWLAPMHVEPAQGEQLALRWD